MATYNVNEPALGRITGFKIDYTKLRRESANFTDTGAGLPRMREIIAGVADALGIPTQFIEVVLNMECDYPSQPIYRSDMPRLGDSKRRLPDPRYPNPVEWAATLPQYRTDAATNRGAQIYIGVTQISWGFWQDVMSHDQMVQARVTLPLAWWTASLYWQIAAPFIYLDRYRSKFPNATLMVPSVVYALHQQGPGGAASNFAKIDGKQSGKTPTIIRAAQHAMRGRTPVIYI